MEWPNTFVHIASPIYFLFLLPFLFFFAGRRLYRPQGRMRLPDLSFIRSSLSFSRLTTAVSYVLLSVSALTLVMALVTPGISRVHEKPGTSLRHTRDIVVVFDFSVSMSEISFGLARETFRSFCESRVGTGDRFALLIFSDKGPYYARPLTSECSQLIAALEGNLGDKTSLISQFSGGTDIVEALLGVPIFFGRGSSASRVVMLISDLGHAGSVSDVVKAIEVLEKQQIKIYVLAINASSSELSAISSLASRTPHVRLFKIEQEENFREVSKTIEALEPASVSIVNTETIAIQEVNRVFLFAALAALAGWAMLQITVRRMV